MPRAQLDLIPFDATDPLLASIIAANIQAVVGLLTDIRAARPSPVQAYMPMRKQYDAAKMIKALAAEPEGAPLKLGITPHDLSIPILTYVYGESQLGGRGAVISLHRLFDTDHQVIYQRAVKVGIHETGHLLGLEHCWKTGCLMRFSKQVLQLDQLPLRFCSPCEYEVARRIEEIRQR